MPAIINSDDGVLSGSSGLKTSGSNDGITVFQQNGTESARITAAGNVGIGTSSPTARLHVSAPDGTAPLTLNTAGGSDSTRALNFNVAGDNYGKILVPSGSGGAMAFWTGAANSASERARITSGGVLCVGNTATGDATGAHIQASTITNSNVGVLRVQSTKTADSADTCVSVFKNANDSTTAQVFVRFLMNAGNSGQGQINANGANAAAFGTFSDARLKENIKDLPAQLGNICSLRPVEFDYIQSEGGGHQIGFIAQEMQGVYPDVVGKRAPDGMLTVTGWSKTEARLVKAIQEQQALIQSLTARIEALERK